MVKSGGLFGQMSKVRETERVTRTFELAWFNDNDDDDDDELVLQQIILM